MSANYDSIREENIREYGEGTRHLAFLGSLYTDRTHFIFELLQNAEDAGAEKIFFDLFEDRLEVSHNGRVFNEQDVRGICGVGEGTKTEDLTKIGKFGIGFKSVYAYTISPKIYSGDESFKIESYVRPKKVIFRAVDSPWTTLFIFPFNTSEISPEKACEEIASRLVHLKARTLLFLRKIKEIEYRLPNKRSDIYFREEKVRGTARQVDIIGENNAEPEEESWLVLERMVAVREKSEKICVELSFRLEIESRKGNGRAY